MISSDGSITAHSLKQEEAFFSEKKITACITGIQWGKTTAGAVWMRHHIMTNLSKKLNFIVTAPTYPILEQSTLPAFKTIMGGLGTFNRQRNTFEMPGTNIVVFFRTAKDPDSIVGITNVKAIWCDEAGKYPLYFWENIQGRAAFMDCPIMITTSPYSLNWIYKEIFKPVRLGLRNDILLIRASSIDNPQFPRSVYDRNKLTMDPRRFNMMYNGDFEKMQGLVYDCYDEIENQCEPFMLPHGTQYFGGIDWGFTDPFVLKVRAVTPEGNHYAVSEFYKTGLTPTDIVTIVKQKKEIFGIRTFFCDPSQPGLIEELNRPSEGFPHGAGAIAADNDISRGIGLHYELIRSRKYKLFRGLNEYTLDETETYHYPEPKDLGPDDSSKDMKPVDKDNHTMDAERYISIGTYRSHIKLVPVMPSDTPKEETDNDRIRRLMKKRAMSKSESWGE